jgi:hypothetical protein
MADKEKRDNCENPEIQERRSQCQESPPTDSRSTRPGAWEGYSLSALTILDD